MTEVEWAYLAGFVDGEGCISASRHLGRNGKTWYYYPHLTLGQKHQAHVVHLLKFGGVLRPQTIKNPKIGTGKSWKWVVKADELEEVLSGLLPYLVVKRSQAQLAIELCLAKGKGERQQQIYSQLKELKHG